MERQIPYSAPTVQKGDAKTQSVKEFVLIAAALLTVDQGLRGAQNAGSRRKKKHPKNLKKQAPPARLEVLIIANGAGKNML